MTGITKDNSKSLKRVFKASLFKLVLYIQQYFADGAGQYSNVIKSTYSIQK